jgi:hypothetical protein
MSILIKIPLNSPLAKEDLRRRPRAALYSEITLCKAKFGGVCFRLRLPKTTRFLSTFNLHDAQFPGLVFG